MGLVNKLQQICTQMGDVAGAGSMLVDKLSSIVVVGGQVRCVRRVAPRVRTCSRACSAIGDACACARAPQLAQRTRRRVTFAGASQPRAMLLALARHAVWRVQARRVAHSAP